MFGNHLLCCPRVSWQNRHSAVQEAVAGLLEEAGQGFTKEVVVPGQEGTQLRPADLLLRAWSAGKETAVDLTVAHGWQASECAGAMSRERWRRFMARREHEKHLKYDEPCRRAQWCFVAMAFGTWGGLGPEGAKTLHRCLKRAAGWLEGDLRAARQEELRLGLGLTLMRQVWQMLAAKSFLG
jgi:hypothetical protein